VALAPANAKVFHETPGYHGALSIDPTTGAILRITLAAELKDDDPITRAAIVVQYGPVMIGDRNYICPIRSLAFSMEQAGTSGGRNSANASSKAVDDAWGSPVSHPDNSPVLLVNETSFSHYHRLGTSIRMVADAPESASANAGPPTMIAVGPVPGSSTFSPPATQPSGTDGSAGTPAPAVAAQPESAPAPPPPAPAQPFIPEISLSAANGVPDEPTNQAPSQSGNYQLKLTSRLVDVGIVAYDKKGHPVKDLKTEDFEIYDNGQKQEVRFFTPFSTEATAPAADPGSDHSFSNRSGDTGPSASTASEGGATILLIDESHIAWPDMSHARQEILKFLGNVAPGERVGLYTMTPLGFRVLQEITTNHPALTAALQKWMPTAQSAALAQEEETRNRQSFNEVHNTADLNSVNGNFTEVPDTEQTVDPQLRTMGSNPARASLIILRMVARHLSAVPGHKNLVWVSSDNVFADWQSQQVAIDKSPKQVDSFALHAQEAMNDAHAAVFPMDISQLESAAINADIRTRNVELNQAAADMASQNGGSVSTNLNPGRNTAEMQQDMHPIQGPIRQVAEATGGRVIQRAGDLSAALAGVVEDGHATYLVSFYPQGPADDQYHNITVKLASKQKGLTLRYRTGYLYSKEPSTLKDRFQQAVWRPLDVSEISVTAGVTSMNSPSNPGAKINLDILAGDLGLQQQASRWMDKLDIFFIQRDDAGLRAQVEGQTLGLRLKPSTYQNLLSAGIPFEHVVQLKPGMASLRVLVVDENSGRMGSVTIPGPALEAAH
jgi:VWFA-related protein